MLKVLMIAMTVAITAACTTTSSAGSPPTPTPWLRDEFIESVRAKAPSTSGVIAMSDDDLWTNGTGTCTALRNNPHTTPALISQSYDERWPGAGATLVGAALAIVCPEFSDRVDD